MNINQLMAIRQNPMQALLQRGFNVPANLCNNPNAIIQYLLNSGQVSQQQYNNAVNLARQFRC